MESLTNEQIKAEVENAIKYGFNAGFQAAMATAEVNDLFWSAKSLLRWFELMNTEEDPNKWPKHVVQTMRAVANFEAIIENVPEEKK